MAGRPLAVVRPSASTVTRSPIRRISSSRCEMYTTPTPSAVSRRTTSKSVSISDLSRIADGSSMISSRTLPDRARAIDTICLPAGRSAPTFARGGIASCPRRASSAAGLAVHLVEVEERAAPGLVREEDALGHAQVVHQVELLVDRRHPALERSRRIPLRQRLAVEQDLAAGGLHRAGDALDQRGLAGSVRTQQAVHLGLQHLEVHALERLDPRVLLHQVPDLEDLLHRTTSPRRLLCATRSPASTSSGVPPQTGSSCSTDSTPSKPPS